MPTWWREGKSEPSFSDGKLFGEVASAYDVSILFYHSWCFGVCKAAFAA